MFGPKIKLIPDKSLQPRIIFFWLVGFFICLWPLNFFYFWHGSEILINQEDILAPLATATQPAILREPVRIIFLGDLMFDRQIRQVAQKNGPDFILAKVKDFLAVADCAVANLEGPITTQPSQSVNTLPGDPKNTIFTFDKSVAAVLANHNIKAVSLANNHIDDFGPAGEAETANFLTASGVDFFGTAEKNSLIKEIKGVKVGLIGYNQFNSLVGFEVALAAVKDLRPQVDLLVVLAHWGSEYRLTATDGTKNIGRALLNQGADLVVGTHPHVIQDKEISGDKTIYYSIGNFIFDQYFDKDVREGLALTLDFDLATGKKQITETRLFLEANGQTSILGL